MVTYSIIQKSQLEGAHRIDAEYYQPEYLDWLNQLRKFKLLPLNKIASKIDVGFVSSMASHFKETGIPLLRTQNVNEFFIDLTNDLVFIDEEFHQKLKKSQVFPGYILLARSGSIGNSSIVPENFPIANSADIILIKIKDNALPEYLSAFLNSRYGQFQIERGSSGGLQGHINLFSLEKVLIPIVNNEFQERIKKIVLAGLNELDNSKLLYSQAENLLLQELNLSSEALAKEEKNCYIVNFSDVQSANRMDAEFFQPKYDRLISHLKTKNPKRLEELVSIKKGFEPGSESYEEQGKLFIRVSNLSSQGLIDKDQKYLSEDLYKKLQKDYQPRLGEILLTKDATPGIAYVLKEEIEGIIAGGILRLKLREEIESEYLALCINSMIGRMQVERDAGGSIISHWKPEQIKNLLIPILTKSTQQKIADLVKKSHEARKKSKELLEEAKRKVEEIIERDSK